MAQNLLAAGNLPTVYMCLSYKSHPLVQAYNLIYIKNATYMRRYTVFHLTFEFFVHFHSPNIPAVTFQMGITFAQMRSIDYEV